MPVANFPPQAVTIKNVSWGAKWPQVKTTTFSASAYFFAHILGASMSDPVCVPCVYTQ